MQKQDKAFSLIQSFLENNQSKIPLLVILGPTASGKTALSIEIAKKFNGEVISADSRQVYKKMDIGTDKITTKEMQGVKHHLLDVVEATEVFTLANYVDLAKKAIADIHNRGLLPILVGGTGLYIDALTQNYELPRIPPNRELREKYEKIAAKNGKEYLHQYLQKIDPQTAKKVHPNNLRYIIRAIEIYEFQKSPKIDKKIQDNSLYNVLKIGIFRPREELYSRINARVETQVERGILEELNSLLKNCPRNSNSMSSLGYKEYFPYLDGKSTLKECTEKLKQNTRNYAKRQLTWFRKDKEIHWL